MKNHSISNKATLKFLKNVNFEKIIFVIDFDHISSLLKSKIKESKSNIYKNALNSHSYPAYCFHSSRTVSGHTITGVSIADVNN